MKNLNLSIVIPAYNEETNIRLGALDKVMRYLDRQTYAWEVLLVDDGSSDATPQLLDAFARGNPRVRVLHNPHRGKAGTVIAGMLASNGEIVHRQLESLAAEVGVPRGILGDQGGDLVNGVKGLFGNEQRYSHLDVKMQDGSTKIVILSEQTSINKASEGSKEDLKTGEQVTAFGTENSDGSVTAQNISIGGMLRVFQGEQSGSK